MWIVQQCQSAELNGSFTHVDSTDLQGCWQMIQLGSVIW